MFWEVLKIAAHFKTKLATWRFLQKFEFFFEKPIYFFWENSSFESFTISVAFEGKFSTFSIFKKFNIFWKTHLFSKKNPNFERF